MYVVETQIRVRYGETDQMGFVYYGNYAQYYETGRIESLRKLGFSYKKIEESGILLPVLSFNIKYIKPAYFDDLLTISTCIREIPKARIKFGYETYNENGDILNIGDTELVFINKANNKPCAAPKEIVEALTQYF